MFVVLRVEQQKSASIDMRMGFAVEDWKLQNVMKKKFSYFKP